MDGERDVAWATAQGLLAGPYVEFVARAGQALELADAFWHLVRVVEMAGAEHDALSPAEIADATSAGRRLDLQARTRLQEEAIEWEKTALAAMEPLPFNAAAAEAATLAEVNADLYGFLGRLIDLQSYARQVAPPLLGYVDRSLDEIQYWRALHDARQRRRRTPLLLRALFVGAVGTVEPLATRMVHLLLYRQSPAKYTSLSDPKLDRDARKLCYGPPENWRVALVDELGVAKLADAVDWDRLARLWEDRNVLAHRGGVVDARHSRVSGLDVGTVLDPDADEVRAAIDEIGAARFAIVVTVWAHLDPGPGPLATASGLDAWEYLRTGRWRLAEGLGRVAEVLAPDAEARATARVNRWLALERGTGPEAIKEPVSVWDVTNLGQEFALARLVLLREDDSAFQLIPALLADGTIDVEALATWPLFDRYREDGRLGDLLS
jgi:hypothetical protein